MPSFEADNLSEYFERLNSVNRKTIPFELNLKPDAYNTQYALSVGLIGGMYAAITMRNLTDIMVSTAVLASPNVNISRDDVRKVRPFIEDPNSSGDEVCGPVIITRGTGQSFYIIPSGQDQDSYKNSYKVTITKYMPDTQRVEGQLAIPADIKLSPKQEVKYHTFTDTSRILRQPRSWRSFKDFRNRGRSYIRGKRGV